MSRDADSDLFLAFGKTVTLHPDRRYCMDSRQWPTVRLFDISDEDNWILIAEAQYREPRLVGRPPGKRKKP